eukprot:TRINITY_DN1650_c0_g5_i1.p1 TRINITY_DN1650_c0_g5~~TRINITY_DN1650_c0_g5_i1.p1  ORF type:complete len:121 (-),score=14.22 TRINITY_DN1650_c0_g5_i1:528-890(-)
MPHQVCKVYTAHDCCCCGSDSAGVADEECTACCSWALELAALQVIADAQATLPKLVQYDVAQRILITTPVVKVIRKGQSECSPCFWSGQHINCVKRTVWNLDCRKDQVPEPFFSYSETSL